MNFKRSAPGSFISKNRDYLYVFGGYNSSIERHDITAPTTAWQLLPLKLPQLANRSGITTIPLWKLPYTQNDN